MKDYFVYSLVSTIPVNDFTLENGCKYSIDAFKPFYIGKGKFGCRGLNSIRNNDVESLKKFVCENGGDIHQIVMFPNLNENDAYAIEKSSITTTGQGNLLNRTNGNGSEYEFDNSVSFIDELLSHDEYGKGKKKNIRTPRFIADKLIDSVDETLLLRKTKKGKKNILFISPDSGETVYSFVDKYNDVIDYNIFIIDDLDYTGSTASIRLELKNRGVFARIIDIEDIEVMKMKFDVCITNPPYNGNIDLKILKKVIPHCKQTICIHPTTWLLGLKKKKKGMEEYKNLINGKVASVELFNGNPIFGIRLKTPVGIFDIRNRKQKEIKVVYFGDEYTVKSLDDITVYGKEWPVVKPLFKKVKKYCSINGSVNDHCVKKDNIDDEKYHCQLAGILGDEEQKSIMTVYKDNFYTMVTKDGELNKGIRKPNAKKCNFVAFSFDTEKERDNFIEYLKTDFTRFCLSFYKNNASLHSGELSLIPWLDFTKKWTDEELYEKFGVSEELQNYITTFLPDYHGVRQ